MEFFGSSETDTVYPFPGDETHWILVKRGLTAGESRQIAHSGLKTASRPLNEDGSFGDSVGFDLDLDRAAFVKVALYLADWNIPGPNGKTVDIEKNPAKMSALRNLTPDVFTAIEKAIDTYVLARLEEKKVPPTSPTSNA